MKKIAAFFLIFAAIVALLGCTPPPNEYEEPVRFYYLRSELHYGSSDSVISHELFEAEGHRDDYEYLISQYLKGPTSDALTRTFPRNVSISDFRVEEDQVYLELSSQFSILSGMDLSIACACLTKTITELTGPTTLHISTEGTLLDGAPSITMRLEDVLFLDISAEAAAD
ncbi:MAG: GerMN domain-containing protein [Faecousia sp.]